MPLQMNREVFITAAVTGSGATQDRSPNVPRSPKQIAGSAIAAAKAGAAVVHCHVPDPETGAPSRDPRMSREVADRIRDSETDVVLNLTAGMGGDMTFGDVETPMELNAAGTDMAGATERVAHLAECLPEICTLDCGTMNFAAADYVMTQTSGMLVTMGRMMPELGVKPEIEASVSADGNVRAGLEDNPMLDRGVRGSNESFVERAVGIIENLGARVTRPEQVRAIPGLVKRAAV